MVYDMIRYNTVRCDMVYDILCNVAIALDGKHNAKQLNYIAENYCSCQAQSWDISIDV